MTKDKRLTDSKDALRLEGVGMLAFSIVALAHTGQGVQTMLMPFGMLLLLNGVARVIHAIWFFEAGSPWRKTVRLYGWSEAVIGGTALLCAHLGWTALEELFSLWLLASGYIYLRRFRLLKAEWRDMDILCYMGTISILGGALLASDVVSGWTSYPYTFILTVAVVGLAKLYTAFKLGRSQRRSQNEYRGSRQEEATYFSPLNLN